MPAAPAAESLRLEVRRTIRATPAAVFRAWTTPTSVRHWFATPKAPVKTVKLEPRSGGRIVIECDVASGAWRLDGRFTAFEAPRRLAFTWVTTDCPAEAGSVVTVDFVDRDGATEIVLVQTGFPGEAKRRDNERGWTELLGHVDGLMGAQRGLRSVARRFIPAPPEAVWKAWTTPALMSVFLSPDGAGKVEADVRVGGRYSIHMGDNGKSYPHQGEYLEVVPPKRLKFTWLSDWSPPDLDPTVTIDLTPVDGGTEVLLVHESQLDEPTRADHEAGWAEFLELLAVAVKTGFAAAAVANAYRAMREAGKP